MRGLEGEQYFCRYCTEARGRVRLNTNPSSLRYRPLRTAQGVAAVVAEVAIAVTNHNRAAAFAARGICLEGSELFAAGGKVDSGVALGIRRFASRRAGLGRQSAFGLRGAFSIARILCASLAERGG